jgi:hypothetical protein
MDVYIYVLRDPRSGDVKYVGKTKNPKDRKKHHSSPSQLRGSGIKKIEWTRELRSLGLRPLFEIIETCSEETWVERERYWIARYGLTNLVNVRPDAIPGNFNVVSEETRKKIRRANRTQFSNTELRERHRETMNYWWGNLSDKEKQRSIDGAAKGRERGLGLAHAAMKDFWSSMTDEEKKEFCKQRTDRQFGSLTSEQRSEIYGQRGRSIKGKILGPRPKMSEAGRESWADPVKRAQRIEKLQVAWARRKECRSRA